MVGYSWYMGAEALRGNGLTQKLLFFFRDKSLIPRNDPLRRVRRSRLALFVAIGLIGFGATFAITQTIGMLIKLCGHNGCSFSPMICSGDWVPGDYLPARAYENVYHPAIAVYLGRTRNTGWTHSFAICEPMWLAHSGQTLTWACCRRWNLLGVLCDGKSRSSPAVTAITLTVILHLADRSKS